MSTFGAALTLWLVAALLLSAPANPAKKDPLQKDARLGTTLSLTPTETTLREVLGKLQERTKVSLLVQSDVRKRPVVVAVGGKSAADILEQIAHLFGGNWEKSGDGYVLVCKDILYLSTAEAIRTGDTIADEKRLGSSLDQLQERVLSVRPSIPFRQLRPDQQQLLSKILVNRYFKSPGLYPSSILTGWGVELRVARMQHFDGGKAQGPVRQGLTLVAPTVQPDGKLVSMPLVELPVSSR